MKLDSKIESKIKKEALKLLEKGKPDWDVPHTLCAVKWMKKLIKAEKGNEKILLPAMYLHDTGYPKLKKGYNYKELIAAKKNHAKLGAKNAQRILPSLGFTKTETKKISHLITNHDKHSNIKNKERQLVFEADGLAQIDWRVVPPNFDKKNCEIWLKKYYDKRKKYIKTKSGIAWSEKLEKIVIKYLKNMKHSTK